jgi:hypothetical protein
MTEPHITENGHNLILRAMVTLSAGAMAFLETAALSAADASPSMGADMIELKLLANRRCVRDDIAIAMQYVCEAHEALLQVNRELSSVHSTGCCCITCRNKVM